MEIIDISRSLYSDLAVWPGDAPFRHRWTARIEDGDAVNLSEVGFSTHAATHADAPLHYQVSGKPVDQIPLLQFIGPCHLIHIKENSIDEAQIAFNDTLKCPRLLFKTHHSNVPDTEWDPSLTPFSVAAIERMSAQGVVLIGTDAPSVDPVDSKELKAHHALAKHGIVNLENLNLNGVEPGPYYLIALPLKLPGLDAAPVRAVLIRGVLTARV